MSIEIQKDLGYIEEEIFFNQINQEGVIVSVEENEVMDLVFRLGQEEGFLDSRDAI